MWAKVGDELIWESCHEKLLGLTIDKQLNFDKHLSILRRKVSGKVSALATMVKIMPLEKRMLLMRTFIVPSFLLSPNMDVLLKKIEKLAIYTREH